MFNATIFKRSMQSSYKIILIFIGVLALYFMVIAGMYDPENLDIMDTLAQMKLSPQLLSAMGFTLTDTSLLGFLSSYFYGLLVLAFPMVCYIILANKLVAGLTDKGSLTYLLATPNTRIRIVFTQACFLMTAITTIVAFVTGSGIAYCESKFQGMLDIKEFILLNVGLLLLHFAVSGICFFASCLFNESKYSLTLGAGLPIAFLLIQMISNSGEKLADLKYATIFTLYSPTDIVKGEGYALGLILLGIIGVTLYTGAMLIFNKKDLPV